MHFCWRELRAYHTSLVKLAPTGLARPISKRAGARHGVESLAQRIAQLRLLVGLVLSSVGMWRLETSTL